MNLTNQTQESTDSNREAATRRKWLFAALMSALAITGVAEVVPKIDANMNNHNLTHKYEQYYGEGGGVPANKQPLPGAVAIINNEPNADALAAEIAKPDDFVNVSHIIQAEAPTIAYGQEVVLPQPMLQEQYQKQAQPNQLPTVTPQELPQQ